MTKRPERNSPMTWGGQLRIYRESLGISQETLSSLLTTVRDDTDTLIRLRIDHPPALAGHSLSKLENAGRIPFKRDVPILLLLVLRRAGLVIDRDTANTWLELGRHGWLTDDEHAVIFGEGGK